MGIKVMGSAYTYCNNESIVCNAMQPKLTLKQKHNAITYHHVREAQAAQMMLVAKIDGNINLADMLIKCLPGPKLCEMVSHVLW